MSNKNDYEIGQLKEQQQRRGGMGPGGGGPAEAARTYARR